MTLLARNTATAARTSRPGPAREHTPESAFLRRWVRRQAARHADLLATVEAARRLPDPHRRPGTC